MVANDGVYHDEQKLNHPAQASAHGHIICGEEGERKVWEKKEGQTGR